jgi:tetratricopeptide (TPR) repeat protein
MPKPIKKKIQKPTLVEEDIGTVFEKVKETVERRQKQIVVAVVVLVVTVVSIVGIILYKGSVRDEALRLEYEGYKSYTGLYLEVPVPEKERVEKALVSFRKAYEIGGSPFSLYYVANCQYELEKYDEAIASLRELNQRFPDDERFVPLSYYKMAMASLKMGNAEEALKAFSVLANYRTDSFKDLALMESARILEQTNRSEEAMKMYEAVARGFPDSPLSQEAMLKAGIENITDLEKDIKKDTDAK